MICSRHLPGRGLSRRRGSFSVLICLIGAVFGFVSGLDSVWAARINLEILRKDGYAVIPIKRPRPNLLTVVADIAGQKQTLLVDTGWGHDSISLHADSKVRADSPPEKRENFGTSASGAKIPLLGKGLAKVVRMGNMELRQVPLEYANIQLEGVASGVIGGGFLRTCSAIIDLENLELFVRPPGTGHRAVLAPALQAAGLAAVPFAMQQYHPVVEVEINGFHGYMALDTGAEYASVDNSLAPKLKAALARSRLDYIDAAGRRGASKRAMLESFKIGGVSVQAPVLHFQDFPFYARSGGKVMGLLGINILGSNGAIIDFGAQKIYFYKAE
jgi:hypothetical protein